MSNDAVADLLTRIRNAQRAGHKMVTVEGYSMCGMVLDVLKREGFIDGFEAGTEKDTGFKKYEVFLKYFSTGEPVIREAKRVSTSGRRTYSSMDKLPKVKHGLGISVVSTSQGVMSDREARKKKIGGEVLALIG